MSIDLQAANLGERMRKGFPTISLSDARGPLSNLQENDLLQSFCRFPMISRTTLMVMVMEQSVLHKVEFEGVLKWMEHIQQQIEH